MSSPDHPNVAVVVRAFRAVEEGNVDAFWGEIADDASAVVVGNGDLAGEFSDTSERDWIPCRILAKLSVMSVGHDHKTARIVQVDATDDHAVLTYEVTTDNSDVRLPGVLVVQMADGQIVSVQHHDPLAQHGGLKALPRRP